MKKKEKLVKKYIDELEKQVKNSDTEEAHAIVDALLCDLLSELGYQKIVKAYKKIDKWYA